ncbi:MAG: hypothetical protein U5L08_04295 [Xanthomonadales bacterium]|nr:hypothetical protein [Xanthomonadales bacterium]
MKTISTEIERRAEEAARNRSRLAHYYNTRRLECGCPVRIHPAHRHLVKRGAA